MRPEQLKFENCWEGFSAITIPEGAPAQQCEAMYLSFLSGAATVLQFVQALQQHAPTNLTSGVEQWRLLVTTELARLGMGSNG